MKGCLPKDCQPRVIGTRSRGIFGYKIDASRWEWHELTGTDHGTDVVLELSDDGLFSGKRVEGQLKGKNGVRKLINGTISFDFDVKTINYALGNANPYVLFLVDTITEIVYYLPIQDYFIGNPDKFEAAEKNISTVTVHINPNYNLDDNGDSLLEIVKNVYIGGPSRNLRKVLIDE